MVSNHEWTLMDTNEGFDLRRPPNVRLLLKDEVFAVVGAAMEVLNELGHGLHEKPYEHALVVEFAPSLVFIRVHSWLKIL